ncbi:TniQ family protein [Streptomyces cyaneofuscatus]|uniref:TniQ family protein n=1 Tax=Streptomyces cyaneofuscatus TaxID=66883 RepID=UPI0033A14E01
MIRPLPRSLSPIPDESLASYVLRLAHRLHISPTHLLGMAGWTQGTYAHHLTAKLLVNIPQAQKDSFAQLTRLAPEEVTELTLSQWRDRYPPIARSNPGTGPLSWSDPWIFLNSPRFCPACLAGDGTPAQQLHGGPWRKMWYLPIAFTCTVHQEFLMHGCAYCDQPGGGLGRMVQRANDHTLHPAQCRWTPDGQVQKRKTRACGHCLDNLASWDPDRPQPTSDMLNFQRSLLTRLAPPATAKDASEYFTDLRLAAALITTTWPQGQHLFDAEAASRIDVHSRKLQTEITGRQRRVRDTPPHDSITCADLLIGAERALNRNGFPELVADFSQAAFRSRPSRASWSRIFDRDRDDCSERLRHAATPVTRAFRRVGGCRGTQVPLRDG